MKNKILGAFSLLALLAVGCERDLETDSVAQPVSIPEVYDFTNGTYAFGLGSNTIFNTIPDTLGIIVDSASGFEGGFGGKTGMDSLYILKSDFPSWPDTTVAGASTVTVAKYSLGNYKNSIGVNILVVEPNPNPGPTELAGDYLRAATGVTVPVSKISAGIYYLDNPGGAGVPPSPYVLKNYKDKSGNDSLSFEIQPNPCGGGLQLVGPLAPLSLTSAEYTAMYPPAITSKNPITFQWKILEFPSVSTTAVHPGIALCQWGTGVRTLVKQ